MRILQAYLSFYLGTSFVFARGMAPIQIGVQFPNKGHKNVHSGNLSSVVGIAGFQLGRDYRMSPQCQALVAACAELRHEFNKSNIKRFLKIVVGDVVPYMPSCKPTEDVHVNDINSAGQLAITFLEGAPDISLDSECNVFIAESVRANFKYWRSERAAKKGLPDDPQFDEMCKWRAHEAETPIVVNRLSYRNFITV